MTTKVEPTVEGWELKAKEALKEKMLYFPIDSILDEMIAGLKPIIEQYTQEKLQEGLDKSSPNFFSMWGHCLDEHNHKKNEQFSWSKTLRKWYKEKKITQKQYRPIKHLILQAIAHSVQEAKAERDEKWKKVIACHNCNGTGRTDNIGGAMECIECGGQCHNLVRFDGIHIDDLLSTLTTKEEV